MMQPKLFNFFKPKNISTTEDLSSTIAIVSETLVEPEQSPIQPERIQTESSITISKVQVELTKSADGLSIIDDELPLDISKTRDDKPARPLLREPFHQLTFW